MLDAGWRIMTAQHSTRRRKKTNTRPVSGSVAGWLPDSEYWAVIATVCDERSIRMAARHTGRPCQQQACQGVTETHITHVRQGQKVSDSVFRQTNGGLAVGLSY